MVDPMELHSRRLQPRPWRSRRRGPPQQLVDGQPWRRLKMGAGLAWQRVCVIPKVRQQQRRCREVAAFGPEVRRDHRPQPGGDRRVQAIRRVFEGHRPIGRQVEVLQGLSVDVRCRLLGSHLVTAHHHAEHVESARTQGRMQERVDIDRGGGAGQRQSAPGGQRLFKKAGDAASQCNGTVIDHRTVELGLLGVNGGQQIPQTLAFGRAQRELAKVGTEALLATGGASMPGTFRAC